MFALLKAFEILQGGNCDSITAKEKELDAAMALVNLILRARLGMLKDIPSRSPFAFHSHIITRDLDPPIKIPRQVDVSDAGFPRHLMEFHDALRLHHGELAKALHDISRGQIFSSRVKARGENLLQGANVLQVRVYKQMDGVWMVRFDVGASMKGVNYVSMLKLVVGSNIFDLACECTAG